MYNMEPPNDCLLALLIHNLGDVATLVVWGCFDCVALTSHDDEGFGTCRKNDGIVAHL